MRHHWLLLGACGWVLLILMFVSKFISFRAVDGELLCVLCAGRHSQVKVPKCDQCVCVCVCVFRLWRQGRSELDSTRNQGGETHRCFQSRETSSKAIRSGDSFDLI